VRTAEFKVLEARANLRKLRRGALSGNRFRIRLRNVRGRANNWIRNSTPCGRTSAQLFRTATLGRDGYNLDRVAAWVQAELLRAAARSASFALSAARSLLFNALLARRVEAGDWSQLAPGDVAQSRRQRQAISTSPPSMMNCAAASACSTFTLRVLSGAAGGRRARVRRCSMNSSVARIGGGRRFAGRRRLTQERRALRCAIRELSVERDASTLTLSFSLRRGQFATAVLREICEFQGVRKLDADEE